ncbi:MAG: RNA methyltransferase [Myxococcota bacterium]
MRSVYCALIHHPVKDRTGETITTAVTNLDVHDLARSARTFDLRAYFVVTPISAQRAITERIVHHWTGGRARIPQRTPAMERIRVAESLEAAVDSIKSEAGAPELVATAARSTGRELTTVGEERARLDTDGPPVLLLFGTGYGLADAALDRADRLLEPIAGRGGAPFNHLSVRAAFAIVLDRLLG